jgi:hypothetical protein
MKNPEPPRLSTWLLERLAPRRRRESLVGDLREQTHRGRSAWWYRRQVAGTILLGLAADLAAQKLLAVRALAIGWSVMYLVYQFAGPLIQQSRRALFSQWGSALWGESEVLRQLWVYYGLPFVSVWCLILIALGWMVAALHRRLPGIVIMLSATLLIPATFQALEIRRLLGTELWPGWGWGSFRWALVFQALLSFVLYPLCVLIGGLWGLRSDNHDLPCDFSTVVDESSLS